MINERYSIVRKIGEGRSKVFLCRDEYYPNKQFAIKILSSDSDSKEINEFKDEFRTLRKLDHPNIIKAFEQGTILYFSEEEQKNHEINIGDRYYTLEFFEGYELLEMQSIKNKYLNDIIKQVSLVLFYLHQSNYIYYDLKPENILVRFENDKVNIKFIDFGLAKFIPEINEFYVRGSAYYISPEILKKETTDHRSDLYSLGILLYRLYYERFPFDTSSEMMIYKGHLENDFIFPDCGNRNLEKGIRKLLSYDPGNRYYTSLHFLKDLGINYESNLSELAPAETYVGRKDEYNSVKKYLSSTESDKVFVVSGNENSGKSSFLRHISYRHDRVVYFDKNLGLGSTSILRKFLDKILFSEFIYNSLDQSIIQYILNQYKNNSKKIFDDIKSLISKISSKCEFTVIFDDIDTYDSLFLEILDSIIPILKANGVHVIVSVTSQVPLLKSLKDAKTLRLHTFDDEEINMYVDRTFAAIFPRETLKRTICEYSNRLPGNIRDTVKDLFYYDIINYDTGSPVVSSDSAKFESLIQSKKDISKGRLKELSQDVFTVAKVISFFDVLVSEELLSKVTGISSDRMSQILAELRQNNIILHETRSILPIISNRIAKESLYDSTENKAEQHAIIARIIKDSFPDFPILELVRHFEKSENYQESYELLISEVHEAENIFAYKYMEELLTKIIQFPIDNSLISGSKILLGKVWISLGKVERAIELFEELLKTYTRDSSDYRKIQMFYGSALIGSGKLTEGIEQLNEYLENSNIIDSERVKLEIANAKFDLNKYESVIKICNDIISVSNDYELLGKANNLLGLVELYLNNNLEAAIEYFNTAMSEFRNGNILSRIAGMEVNLGNMYNMLEKYEIAEKHWNKAIQINQSIGNLEQEGKVILNYGIYYYDHRDFERGIRYYERALKVFHGLGNELSKGLAYTNLGESYLEICDYYNAILNLRKGIDIFHKTNNIEELLEAYYLLLKTQFFVEDFQEFDKTYKAIKEIMEREGKNESIVIKITILYKLKELKNRKRDIELSQIPNLLKGISNQFNQNEFLEYSILFAEMMTSIGEYKFALSLINSEEFIQESQKNVYYNSGKLYILAIVAEECPKANLKSSISYILEAYKIIEKESISLLTLKILSKVAKIYLLRGNRSKAESFIVYTKYLIKYFADMISDNRLKMIYLESKETKKVLSEIDYN